MNLINLTIASRKGRLVSSVSDTDRSISVRWFVQWITHHHHLPIHRYTQTSGVHSPVLYLWYWSTGGRWKGHELERYRYQLHFSWSGKKESASEGLGDILIIVWSLVTSFKSLLSVVGYPALFSLLPIFPTWKISGFNIGKIGRKSSHVRAYWEEISPFFLFPIWVALRKKR